MRRDFGWRHNELPDEIVQTYADMVYKLALSQTRNPDKAQDVFQEVFLRYIRNQKPFEGEEHRKAWLIRVTVNCCRNAFGFWETHTVALDDAVQAIPLNRRSTATFTTRCSRSRPVTVRYSICFITNPCPSGKSPPPCEKRRGR